MNQEALKLFGRSLIYSSLLTIIFIILSVVFLFPLLFNINTYIVPFSLFLLFISFPFIINKAAHSVLFGWKSKLLPYVGNNINMIKGHFSFNAHLLIIILTITFFYFTGSHSYADKTVSLEVESKYENLLSIYRMLKNILPNEIANLSFVIYSMLYLFSMLLFYRAILKVLLNFRLDLYFLYIINNNKHTFKEIVKKYEKCKWTDFKIIYSFLSIIFCTILYLLVINFVEEPIAKFFLYLTISIWMNLYLFVLTWKEYEEIENYKPTPKEKKKRFNFKFGLSKN